jgi:hypothetical protein
MMELLIVSHVAAALAGGFIAWIVCSVNFLSQPEA